MPLSSTHALNGDRLGPAVRRKPKMPSMTEVALADDRAAEHAALAVEILGRRMHDEVGAQRSGRCSAGVQKQLSTASSAPARA